MTTTWYINIGIVLLVLGEFQLLIVCLLGTVYSAKVILIIILNYYLILKHLNFKCVELERENYNVEWYSMELPQRKKFLIFLQIAQNPIEPTFGGLGYLNLNAFLQVKLKNKIFFYIICEFLIIFTGK